MLIITAEGNVETEIFWARYKTIPFNVQKRSLLGSPDYSDNVCVGEGRQELKPRW